LDTFAGNRVHFENWGAAGTVELTGSDFSPVALDLAAAEREIRICDARFPRRCRMERAGDRAPSATLR
jgi:hypothetical protein